MPDDPYKDAPVQNPYSGSSRFSSGVARQQRVIENAYYERRRQREAQERENQRQQEEADRLARSRIDERNKAFKEQAKEEGFEDFVYEDEEGALRSALTDEQTEQLRRQNQENLQEKAEQEAARFRARDIERRMGGLKKNVLTDYQREKREEELAKKQQALQMWQTDIEEGRVDSKDAQQDIDLINNEISTLNKEIADDDAVRLQLEELQEQKWAEEDLRDGRPEGLPRSIPTDPEERKDFIEGYNARATRLNTYQQRLSEHAAASAEKYRQRTDEVRERYKEWVAQGVSPSQQQEALGTLNAEITKSTVGYLRDRFKVMQEMKKVEDEAAELEMLKPFISEAVSAHNVWVSESNKAAEAIRQEGRKRINDLYEAQAKEFGKYSKKAAETIRLARDEALINIRSKNRTPLLRGKAALKKRPRR